MALPVPQKDIGLEPVPGRKLRGRFTCVAIRDAASAVEHGQQFIQGCSPQHELLALDKSDPFPEKTHWDPDTPARMNAH